MTSAALNSDATRALRRASRGAGTREALAGTFIALLLLAPCRGAAEEPATTAAIAAESAATATAPQPASVRLSWETGAGKSYLVPALEIVGFDLLLNQFNRRYFDGTDYDTSLSTV